MKKFFLFLKNFMLSLILKIKFNFSKISKNDVIICFDCLYDNNQECIDALTFFEYLQKKNISSKYVALKNSCSKDKLSGLDNVIFVKNRWEFVFKYSNLLKASKAVLTSFGLLCGIDGIIKKYNKNYVFIEHGVIFHQEFLDKLYSCDKFNKILVPTKYTFDLYKNNSSWDEKNLILAGLPRWDNYSISSSNTNIFVFFTWRKAFLKNKKAINSYFKSILEFLNTLAQNIPDDFKITFAWHHEIYKNGFQLPKLPSRIELIKPQDFASNVFNSSLFVTDYSSVFWDYFYQNKPVVFYNPINLDFENNIDKNIEKSFVNFSAEIYNCFTDLNLAIGKILYYVHNNFILEDKFKAINEQFFWNKSKNCQEILKIFE